ncbi:hypothetical protein [Micromonospora sp. WMMC415]|uniref:hypothetical protein n=1 Tax=Micromonospora sp. WMMC415 TaxID=2675222 RepID=UPI0018AF8D2A|nr:hypothetical protein [Micromonospora sp. WMMC415]
MDTHCLVGITDPENPHLVRARFVVVDGHPSLVVPALAGIWARHAGCDTRALAAAILACDWEYLDPTITTTASDLDQQHPVPGVGMPLPGSGPAEPVTVFPLCQAGHLDVQWIYLIGPAAGTVAVHSDDGQPVACYRLDQCVSPPAGSPRAARDHTAAADPASGAQALVPGASR